MKKFLNVLLWAGCVILGVLIIASLIGIIYFSVNYDLSILNVVISIFITSLGSLLTILALIITVQSNNKMYNLNLIENKNNCKRIINALSNSLSLDKISMAKCMQPKNITHKNIHSSESRQNLPINLVFSGAYLESLNKIALREFGLVFRHETMNGQTILITLEEEPKYMNITNLGSDMFAIKLITNVDINDYYNLIDAIKNNCEPVFNLDYCFDIQSVDNVIAKIEGKGKYIFDKSADDRKYFEFKKYTI